MAAEGVEAEPEALEVLARRAAGSMRDSQSLLEQLLAFSPGRITVADVHGMLGTAGEERLAALVGHLIDRNPAAALADLDAATDRGRRCRHCSSSNSSAISAIAWWRRWAARARRFFTLRPPAAEQVAAGGQAAGIDTLLAVMQILDQTLSRMRYSTQGRILAELALVRISQLEDLDELSEVIAQLQSGAVRLRSADAAARRAGPLGRPVCQAAPRGSAGRL